MVEVIPHWLSRRAELTPNQDAIEQPDGEVLTYKELMYKSKNLACKLASLGIKKGDHIALLFENHPSFMITFHALTYIGAVSVLLNTRLRPTEHIYQLQDGHVKRLITSEKLLSQAIRMDIDIPIDSFTELNSLPKKEIAFTEELCLDDPCTIIYTSGTTGFPKGVIHTYGNHWWSALSSALNLGLHAQDKWLLTLPIFHVGGLSIIIRTTIYGIPLYLLERFSEKEAHIAIMTKQVTIMSAVTVMVKRLLGELGEGKYPETFRCMLLGGGPCPQVILEKAKDAGIPLFQSYGMTETSSQIVTLSAASALDKLGSSGKPLFSAQLKIDKYEGELVGDIYVKGPMVTSGYYNNPKKTAEGFHNGWLITGDMGYLDDEGFLYVVDRRKDLIISGGENIYPTEIESVILGISGVEDVGVVGVYDAEWGQVPVAFVVSDILTEIIEEKVSHLLASYKQPKAYYNLKELPRNASKKLMRHKLIDLIDKERSEGDIHG